MSPLTARRTALRPLSVVVVHHDDVAMTASTALKAALVATQNPSWDAELILVCHDAGLLPPLLAPFGGDVVAAQRLEDVVPTGRVVEVLRAGQELSPDKVTAELARDLPSTPRRVSLSVVMVCDDDTEAVGRTLSALADGAGPLLAEAELVMVSRGGEAASRLLPALSGDVRVVDCHERTDLPGAFAVGMNAAASSTIGLLVAGEPVSSQVLARLLEDGGLRRLSGDARSRVGALSM